MLRNATLFLAAVALVAPAAADDLPSWRDSASRDAIVAFVDAVTDPASADFVPVPDRIAVFDNDGTLWAEQPVYFQLYYALDRLREKAAADPSILTSDILRAAADGDMEGMMAGGTEGLVEILDVSHSGVTVEAFQADVSAWLETARHPTTDRAYDEMTYQPMVELLEYLRAAEFETWIVSGGGIHFIRAFAEDAYGIPPSQVIGSRTPTTYDEEAKAIVKDPGIAFVDDKAGKPVGIDTHIGQVPILAGGNSDGDFAMLDYVTSASGPRLGILVHHTDAEREFAYDRDGHIGILNRGLDEAEGRGWVLVNMAEDWDRIWPAE